MEKSRFRKIWHATSLFISFYAILLSFHSESLAKKKQAWPLVFETINVYYAIFKKTFFLVRKRMITLTNTFSQKASWADNDIVNRVVVNRHLS